MVQLSMKGHVLVYQPFCKKGLTGSGRLCCLFVPEPSVCRSYCYIICLNSFSCRWGKSIRDLFHDFLVNQHITFTSVDTRGDNLLLKSPTVRIDIPNAYRVDIQDIYRIPGKDGRAG